MPMPEAEAITGVPRAQQGEPILIPSASAPHHAGQADADLWHFAKGEKRSGPISTEAILQMIERGELGSQDHVWRKGWPEWRPIEKTPLIQATTTPPPLTGSAVGNKLVWTVAILQLLFGLLESQEDTIHARTVILFSVILTGVLLSFDWHGLKMAGYTSRYMALCAWFFWPAYLFMRARMLSHKWLSYFVVSLAAAILTAAI